MPVAISVVIPAFNEEDRLPPFLAEVRSYLANEFPDSHEIIVVDDGSTDRTAVWLDAQTEADDDLVAMHLPTNRGKGAAVRAGVLASNGGLVLFCDADGATAIEQERRLRAAIAEGADVAAGSRVVESADVRVRRSIWRRLVGRMFNAIAGLILRPPVRDSQCGFKMFRGDVGRKIAAAATEDGYLFDLEWLCLADRYGCRIVEAPVEWTEKPGSKLRMGREALHMVRSLLRLRRRLKQVG